MEILVSIFYLLTAIILVILLIFWLQNKNPVEKWYNLPMFFISIMLFMGYLCIGMTLLLDSSFSDKSIDYKSGYTKGYNDCLNTKFEQRIDTVYIKKK
jgi:uncharacterized integral membrane protein